MYYFLYVGLDQFYVSRFKPPQITVVHEGGRVLDSCEGARARSVRPGLSLSEAKSILRDQAKFVPYSEEQHLSDRDVWLDVCLNYSSLIEAESPASAWIDLSLHPDPFDVACRLVQDLCAANYKVSAALSPSKWVSKTAARPCNRSAVQLGIPDVPFIASLSEFLEPLPTRLAAPIAREHRERLVFLGYRKVGDVRDAPLSALIKQFGKDAFLINEVVHGRFTDRISPNYPKQVVECYRAFSECVENRFDLETAGTEIAAKLSESLQRQDRLAGSIELYIELEDGSVCKTGRKLPRPTDSLERSVLYLLGQQDLDQPVASVRAVVPDVRTSSSVQRSMDTSDRSEQSRATRATVNKIHAMFGKRAITRASDIRPSRRELLLRAWKHATGWR